VEQLEMLHPSEPTPIMPSVNKNKVKALGQQTSAGTNSLNALLDTYQNLQSRFGIERHPYTKNRIGQIPCVCMYVCVTTPPKPLNDLHKYYTSK